MRIPITGSRVHRVWKCPPSAILPQVVADSSAYEPARRRGKEIHRYLELARKNPDALDEMEPGPTRNLCAALDLSDLPVDLATEVAFAWNWRAMSARLLVDANGQPIVDRAYDLAIPPLSEDEIGATLDLVGVGTAKGYVGDYKSGHGKYPAPDQFGQLLLGASCVRSVYDLPDMVVELIHIHDDGTHHKVRRSVNEWDMDHFEVELKAAMELTEYWEVEYAAGRAVAAHEGTWCQYCDAYKSCPAKVALVNSIPQALMSFGVKADPETGALALSPGALVNASVERLADAWMMRDRIVDVMAKISEEICSLAAYMEIPLPDGRVIGQIQTERRDLNGKIAHDVLERRYGRETADAAVELESSFSAIHLAVQANIKPGEKMKTRAGDGVEDKVIAEIDRLGGIKVNVSVAVKPHVPKKKRLPR